MYMEWKHARPRRPNESHLSCFRTSPVSHAWSASWRARCSAAVPAPAGSSAPGWSWSSRISTRACRSWCIGYAAISRRTAFRARRCSACRAVVPGWQNGWELLSSVEATPIWKQPDVRQPPRLSSVSIWRNCRSPSSRLPSLADWSTYTLVRTVTLFLFRDKNILLEDKISIVKTGYIQIEYDVILIII